MGNEWGPDIPKQWVEGTPDLIREDLGKFLTQSDRAFVLVYQKNDKSNTFHLHGLATLVNEANDEVGNKMTKHIYIVKNVTGKKGIGKMLYTLCFGICDRQPVSIQN